MFMWHEKHYVGAAHGIVGIMFMLLQVKKIGKLLLKQTKEHKFIKASMFPFGFW